MKKAFEKFKSLTGYDIQSFFSSYVSFSNTYYPVIVQYYTKGNSDIQEAFSVLDGLIKQSNEIEPLFRLRQSSLKTIDFWEILDMFTDCQTKLWTINNSSRWLRSAIIGRYGNSIAVQRILKTRETFEEVVQGLGSSDPQNDWISVSRNNLIEEEDYTANAGGGMFQVSLKSYGNFDVPNIVDNLSDEKILGKDMSVRFEIVNNDFVCVDYNAAVYQALNTMISSLKGGIPEIPDYGLPNDIIGSSSNAIQYPVIFKHLLDMFQRDDRWVEVNLLDIYYKEDNLFMKISAKVITNNYLITNIQI